MYVQKLGNCKIKGSYQAALYFSCTLRLFNHHVSSVVTTQANIHITKNVLVTQQLAVQATNAIG
jgi:hypothetical protein